MTRGEKVAIGIGAALLLAAIGATLPQPKERELTDREKIDQAAQRLEHFEHCRDYPTALDCR
jgi:hypothetical protein